MSVDFTPEDGFVINDGDGRSRCILLLEPFGHSALDLGDNLGGNGFRGGLGSRGVARRKEGGARDESDEKKPLNVNASDSQHLSLLLAEQHISTPIKTSAIKKGCSGSETGPCRLGGLNGVL
jgi:hypothetical protein